MANKPIKIKITKQSIPYILIDKVTKSTELVRMPQKPSQTPEFRLCIKSEEMETLIKDIRKLCEKYKEVK